MSKRVLVLTTSARRGGNSEKLAQAFAKGAEQAGHAVTATSLSGSCRAGNR